MELSLVFMGLVFVVMGLLVGVKKMVWLVAGYNHKRVADKEKLARLVGGTFGVLGIGLVVSGMFPFADAQTVIMVAVALILAEVAYVNLKMVE